jgi:hypothetical protein
MLTTPRKGDFAKKLSFIVWAICLAKLFFLIATIIKVLTPKCISKSSKIIDHHRNIASGLQSAYEKVASSRSAWCTRVPIHTISQSHALGSQEPWVEGLSMRLLFQRGPIFHPNLNGMEAVASKLVNLTKKDN